MKPLVFPLALVGSISTASFAQEPVWDGNAVVLESQELADGIFAVIPQGAAEMAGNGLPLATSSGFVVGEDSVLVINTMLNERLSACNFLTFRAILCLGGFTRG